MVLYNLYCIHIVYNYVHYIVVAMLAHVLCICHWTTPGYWLYNSYSPLCKSLITSFNFGQNAPKPSHPSETSLENCLGGCCLWIFTAAKDSVPSWIQARDRWTNIRKTLGPADPTQTTCCLQSCTVVNLSTTEHAHTELYDYMCSFTQTVYMFSFLHFPSFGTV